MGKFHLAPLIRLNTPVINAQATLRGWKVTSPDGVYFSRYLIAATGVHNQPVIPQVQRQQSAIEEFHSSALRDPCGLSGKDVVVVGGARPRMTCSICVSNTRREGLSGSTARLNGWCQPESPSTWPVIFGVCHGSRCLGFRLSR